MKKMTKIRIKAFFSDLIAFSIATIVWLIVMILPYFISSNIVEYIDKKFEGIKIKI